MDKFVTILDFFISRLKKKTGRFREVILAVGDMHQWPLPVVESWPLQRSLNKGQCMGCLPGQNRVVVVEGCPLIQRIQVSSTRIRLYVSRSFYPVQPAVHTYPVKTVTTNVSLQNKTKKIILSSVLLYSRGRIKTEGFEKDDDTELNSV